jgi:uncharacterized protein
MRPANAPPAFQVLAKPTGAICNLDCKYCFFLSKEMLYPGSRFRMADELLEEYIRQYIEAQAVPEVTISWQGGEPTLMGVDFFRRSVEYVEKYRKPNMSIEYTIQTNGTTLDDEWGQFFHEHNFLIGLSIDGPPALHDAYRVDKGGQPTFDRVLRGLEFLKKHKVDFNILCTVHAANADYPVEVYRFFRDGLEAEYFQFIPIVERASQATLAVANQGWGERPGGTRPLYVQEGDLVTERTVQPEQYGRFLIGVFDEWVRHDVARVYVQHFDVALGAWVGQPGAVCIFAPTCGNALAIEHNGDLYACDHFVEPDYLLGNIQDRPMIELVASDKQRKFGQDKKDTLPAYCRECEVLFACHGGCPKNRFCEAPRSPQGGVGSETPDGEAGLNYLCAGYKAFFNHIDRPMRIMAELLRQDRAPAEIVHILAAEEAQMQTVFANAGRNDPCPCGSGRKYKHCHG